MQLKPNREYHLKNTRPQFETINKLFSFLDLLCVEKNKDEFDRKSGNPHQCVKNKMQKMIEAQTANGHPV